MDARADIPTWSSWLNQPTAQLYHVAPDYRFPYWVTGAQQDSGAVAVASRGRFAGHLDARLGAGVCRRRGRLHRARSAPPRDPVRRHGHALQRADRRNEERVARAQHDRARPPHVDACRSSSRRRIRKALYFSNQFLFKTTDGGESAGRRSARTSRARIPACRRTWTKRLRPTRRQGKRRGVIYTIAPSPLRAPLIWVGTDDGLIHVTQDDGKTWQNVTPPALTPWSKVVMMDASHFDVNEAFAAIDRHRLDRQRAAHLPHARRRQDVAGDRPRAAGGRLPADGEGGSGAPRACCLPARSWACSCRSTTATTGSRCS